MFDLDELSSWRIDANQLLLSFRNGTAITVELKDQREAEEILKIFQAVQHKNIHSGSPAIVPQ